MDVKAILLVFMLAQVSHIRARRRQIQGENSSVAVTWQHRLHGAHLHLPRDVTHVIRRRSISLAAIKPNRAFQQCLMPGNRPGRCRHLQYCVLEDFRSSFPRFLDYMCVIQRSYVGVCCPDSSDKDAIVYPSHGSGLLSGILNPPQRRPVVDEKVAEAVEPPSDTGTPLAAGTHTRGCGVGAGAERLVGGSPADIEEWPWMAAVIRDTDVQFCGGALISERHVLTAAHCLVGYKAADLLVRLGEYDFDRPDETRYRDFGVDDISSHADFQQDTYENDIAILRLRQAATFNSYIWPACLPPSGDQFENQTATVIGWGTLSFGGAVSAVLMEVAVPVWVQQECIPLYAQPILDTVLCAGVVEGGKDACQGDSGGPLLLQLPNKRWAVIGIVSWGIRCGNPQQPGIYTRVNAYLDWIVTNSVF